ncbi:unnamed protein product [Ostreobium quekettii]|uniref:Uncharacterized protein n=1 Tax=Ostreobium quekettii TaxID=121088 RepID=A0A8S1J7Y7_9CHLO|nr:unnamed protein product [Ostreobium quekettii]
MEAGGSRGDVSVEDVLGKAQRHGAKSMRFDKRTFDELKAKALRKAQEIRKKAESATAENLQHARHVARDIASSKDARDAGRKVWSLWKKVDTGAFAQGLARALVCLYFVNLVYEDLESWMFLNQPESRARFIAANRKSFLPSFPWMGVCVLLPCAALATLGYYVPITASALLLDMLKESASMIWTGLKMLFLFGRRPNELMVKRLAMVGCSALVLANSVKNHKKLTSYAGPLLSKSNDGPGHRKSIALLFGRLLMAVLFVYVGYVQIRRVLARDWSLWRKKGRDHWGIKDGHDNNWLLLEFALSLPFAVGYQTEIVSRGLSLILALEAVTCWPFWSTRWPTWHYKSHVRAHFVTNLAVSGGLIMLQSFGAGKYTVDRLLKRD